MIMADDEDLLVYYYVTTWSMCVCVCVCVWWYLCVWSCVCVCVCGLERCMLVMCAHARETGERAVDSLRG